MVDNSLRLREVNISESFFAEQFTTGNEPQFYSIVEGLPEDAELVGVRHEHNYQRIVFIYRHESFDIVNVKDWLGGKTPKMDFVLKDKRDVIKQLFKINDIDDSNDWKVPT